MAEKLTHSEQVNVRSLDEAEVLIGMLVNRTSAMERQLMVLEEEHDTFLRTALWRRWMFMIDGWSGHRLETRPQWRPWRRWWRS